MDFEYAFSSILFVQSGKLHILVRYSKPKCDTEIFYMLYFNYLVSRSIRSPITLTEKLNLEKPHFNTSADDDDRLMTEAPTRMFGLIMFILGSKIDKIQTVTLVG